MSENEKSEFIFGRVIGTESEDLTTIQWQTDLIFIRWNTNHTKHVIDVWRSSIW